MVEHLLRIPRNFVNFLFTFVSGASKVMLQVIVVLQRNPDT